MSEIQENQIPSEPEHKEIPQVSADIEKTAKPKKRFPVTALIIALSITGGTITGGISGAYIASQNKSTSPTQTTVIQRTSTSSTTGVEDIAAVASNSVVEITTKVKTYDMFGRTATGSSAGSGVILTSDGYIVTNYHVIDAASSITIRLSNGSEYQASVVGSNESKDLALLKIEATNLVAATFADSDAIKVGELAVAIGNPLGTLGGTVTEGIVSATNREITIDNTTLTLIQTSAAVNSGNSGGGLFDQNGHLIGIVNAKSTGTNVEGLGFAIPSNTVKSVIEKLLNITISTDYNA